uniref:Uncharacterized protein n=1 Tax=Angiostrongylus cantonensis TaxID=6313 RepID=A0A0K0DAT9_ANGCA
MNTRINYGLLEFPNLRFCGVWRVLVGIVRRRCPSPGTAAGHRHRTPPPDTGNRRVVVRPVRPQSPPSSDSDGVSQCCFVRRPHHLLAFICSLHVTNQYMEWEPARARTVTDRY